MLYQVISTINRRIQPLFLGNWTLSNGGPILYSLHLTRIKPSSHRIIPGTLQEHLVNPYTPGSDMVLQVLDQELGSQFYSAQNMCKVYKTSVFVQTPRASWEMISQTSYRNGYGSIPIDTFLVGWTSIYQLFWGSLGTRVLTHPQICRCSEIYSNWWGFHVRQLLEGSGEWHPPQDDTFKDITERLGAGTDWEDPVVADAGRHLPDVDRHENYPELGGYKIIWWFHMVSMNGGTLKWMVHNGKSYENGWFKGTPMLGNLHIRSIHWDNHEPTGEDGPALLGASGLMSFRGVGSDFLGEAKRNVTGSSSFSELVDERCWATGYI